MIRVQARDYTTELTPPGLASHFVGQTMPEEQRILVATNMHEQKQQATWWHEMTHIWLLDESELSETLGHQGLEGLINRISSNIYATLTENGLLVEDWWEKAVDKRPEEEDDTRKLVTNVTEKDDLSSRKPEYPDESVRDDSHARTVLPRGEGNVG